MSEQAISQIIAAASGLFGAIIGGAIAAFGSIRAVKVISKNLERDEIRRQKIQCVVSLYALRWVAGLPKHEEGQEELKARLSTETCKIISLWGNDEHVMSRLRDLDNAKRNDGPAEAYNKFIELLRCVGVGLGSQFENLSDKDIRSCIRW